MGNGYSAVLARREPNRDAWRHVRLAERLGRVDQSELVEQVLRLCPVCATALVRLSILHSRNRLRHRYNTEQPSVMHITSAGATVEARLPHVRRGWSPDIDRIPGSTQVIQHSKCGPCR